MRIDGEPVHIDVSGRGAGRSASRPCTRTSPCSTTSSRRRTSIAGREDGATALAARGRCGSSTAGRWPSATTEVLERLQVSLPDRNAPVGLMSGGQRQVDRRGAGRRVRLEGRHPRRADRRARTPRVAARPRPDHATARRGPGGHRHLPRPRPRHRGGRPGGGDAARPQGRRGDPDRREPAADRGAHRRLAAQRPRRPSPPNTTSARPGGRQRTRTNEKDARSDRTAGRRARRRRLVGDALPHRPHRPTPAARVATPGRCQIGFITKFPVDFYDTMVDCGEGVDAGPPRGRA